MTLNKIISSFFILCILLYSQRVKAQLMNINGDTILVNMEAEVQIVFPAPPSGFNTIPANSQYRIWNVKNGIYLIPGAADSTPVTLLVAEAGRMHRFILTFKQVISNSEAKLYYDYSTINKIAQHNKSKAVRAPLPQKTEVYLQPVKKDTLKKAETIETNLSIDSSSAYYVTLERGEKALLLENYEDAILNFNKAHALRPEDNYPLKRLEETKIRRTEKDKKAAQDDIEKNYTSFIAEAKYLLNQNKFSDAREAYKKALEIKPQDLFAAQQMQTISNYLLKVSLQTPKDQGADLNNATIKKAEAPSNAKLLSDINNYNATIGSADSFFKEENYDSAKVLYSKALLYSNRDWPKEQLKKINKIINARVISQKRAEDAVTEFPSKPDKDSVLPVIEPKRNYALTLANARSSFIKNDLVNAKVFYEEALRLQPLQPEPINQLKIINNKLEVIALEAEINDSYERIISLADSLAITKSYAAAISAYQQASAIKPLELYPKKEVRFMQSEFALSEKTNKEEKEKRYNEVITRADKAVADKRFEEAKSAYTEALSLHPENEYAKKRLEIISYQIDKAIADKLQQDTISAVTLPLPPEKKKRKKP